MKRTMALHQISTNLYRRLVFLGFLTGAVPSAVASDFAAVWPADVERTWLGPEFWANPLQDWKVTSGRIECLVARENPGTPGACKDSLRFDGEPWCASRPSLLGRLNDDEEAFRLFNHERFSRLELTGDL